MDQSKTHADLLDAFARDGCPVCQVVLPSVAAYIDSVEYESVNDPGFRRQTNESWGFCNVHAQQWLSHASVLSTAFLYRSVLETADQDLERLGPTPRGGVLAEISSFLEGGMTDAASGRQALRPREICPVCRKRAEYERLSVDVLTDNLREETFRQAFSASSGLCLPHLRAAFAVARSPDAFAVLKDHALRQHHVLHEQLTEIVRKNDYRFRSEPSGSEYGAGQRAVRTMTGEPGIDDRGR